ncbi:RecT family recombinase [Paenibacillus pseudetheri]|uniref:Protein RecT n=1 Tax=Paenibacillus pseudetheri TaxID=2897682 RepID=A0ABN8FFY4_9BACL|nr:RecT family recombinase [Paenibacillus pseudetheri]CAH1054061.1 Protein RecT [Paenibacillus pseudetheri]
MTNAQPNTQLATIHSNLEKLIDAKSEALPSGFNKTRFMQNCLTVLQDTNGIAECNAMSVARTMLKGAFLGLDFFNKECYAIIYGGSVEFQTDYKGEVKLAKKYSINKIKDIYAKLVRIGDEFTETIEGGKQSISFKPLPFNDGEILGAFAIVLYEDGSMNYDTMSKKEIEEIKVNFSRKNKKTNEYSKAWVATPGEMYKKTILRRLCKNIELDFDTIEQKKAFEEAADMDFNQERARPAQESPLNPKATVIDGEFTEVKEGVSGGTEQE